MILMFKPQCVSNLILPALKYFMLILIDRFT